MYRNINNYYFSRPNLGYAYANPYGMNFSRSYPRVVIYNGQQNFNIHDSFPDEHRQKMIQDINNPFIQDYLSKIRSGIDPKTSEAVRFLGPRGKRAVTAAMVADPEFRKRYGDREKQNLYNRDVADVSAAIDAAKSLRKGDRIDRDIAKSIIHMARPAMGRVNKAMLSAASDELDHPSK